ncbi:TadE/TadG family type IV pilus assembly protein [Lentibacillus saliphilus]|uniref:TadE/TadG family type IV pilus assembly protein n=1 Tax=Lentibacillus saliphilus TaxID=2737028 RepID=UPI001C2F65B1|nr:TadE family protein [Lentibacillus saliphilus]
MKVINDFKENEDGSATIEFLGIVPIVLIILMVVVQFVVGIHGVIVAQSAVNEYASVYAVTGDTADADATAQKILDTASYVSGNLSVSNTGGKNFTADINVNISLIFFPEKLRENHIIPNISYTTSTSGRVIE